MYAAEHEHYEMVRLLLNKGSNVNAQGRFYGNALQAALEEATRR
jgi:ankyrin repeat protein